MTGPSKPVTTPEAKESTSLLPKVAGYTLALIGGCLVVALWLAVGFPLGSLVDVVLMGAVGLLIWDRENVHYKADTATDEADKAVRKADTATDAADQAIGRIEAVEHLLSGLEPPGRGKHATSASPAQSIRRNPA